MDLGVNIARIDIDLRYVASCGGGIFVIVRARRSRLRG